MPSCSRPVFGTLVRRSRVAELQPPAEAEVAALAGLQRVVGPRHRIGMPDTGIARSVNDSVKLPSFRSPATLTVVSRARRVAARVGRRQPQDVAVVGQQRRVEAAEHAVGHRRRAAGDLGERRRRQRRDRQRVEEQVVGSLAVPITSVGAVITASSGRRGRGDTVGAPRHGRVDDDAASSLAVRGVAGGVAGRGDHVERCRPCGHGTVARPLASSGDGHAADGQRRDATPTLSLAVTTNVTEPPTATRRCRRQVDARRLRVGLHQDRRTSAPRPGRCRRDTVTRHGCVPTSALPGAQVTRPQGVHGHVLRAGRQRERQPVAVGVGGADVVAVRRPGRHHRVPATR